jgi:hypothetical protein
VCAKNRAASILLGALAGPIRETAAKEFKPMVYAIKKIIRPRVICWKFARLRHGCLWSGKVQDCLFLEDRQGLFQNEPAFSPALEPSEWLVKNDL